MSFGISNEDTTVEVMNKYPILEKFCDHLHGSGIDYDWTAEETKNHVKLHNSYHCMNEAGMYCATQDFTITMPKNDIADFKITCDNKSRYWWDRNCLRDYLYDTAHYILSEALKADAEKRPVESGFIAETKYRLVKAQPNI